MHATVAEARAVLARTPATFDALLRGLAPAWTEADEGPETFSPLDVLGHLIDGERCDWIPRMEHLLAHGEQRPFEPFDRFVFRERLADLGLEARLDTFAADRARSLARLDALQLGDEQLARTGSHPELGRVTMAQLLSTWTVHDLSHLAQVARVMARRWGGAAGPWAAYLPILDRI